jgi:hypothetical protein
MYCRPLQTLTPARGGGYWCFTAASPGRVQQPPACRLAPPAGSLQAPLRCLMLPFIEHFLMQLSAKPGEYMIDYTFPGAPCQVKKGSL